MNETEINQFVTAIYAILDPSTGELTISNAGHCPLYHISGNNSKEIVRYPASGIPIGVEKDHTWKNEKIYLQSNDLIVFYTDGIIEAENIRGDLYGENNLQKSIRGKEINSASEASHIILQDLSIFVEGTSKGDDIALITLVRE